MKIIISKAQWKAIGKIAGWLYYFCSWCGKAIDMENGMLDPRCRGLKCKVKDSTSPDDFESLSDGICKKCLEEKTYLKKPEQLPYNLSKGNTPKDEYIKYLKSKQNVSPNPQ